MFTIRFFHTTLSGVSNSIGNIFYNFVCFIITYNKITIYICVILIILYVSLILECKSYPMTITPPSTSFLSSLSIDMREGANGSKLLLKVLRQHMWSHKEDTHLCTLYMCLYAEGKSGSYFRLSGPSQLRSGRLEERLMKKGGCGRTYWRRVGPRTILSGSGRR